MLRRLASICLLLTPIACAAQVSDADLCRNGVFPREQESLSLGVIQGQRNEKVHFFDDHGGCPSQGAQCRQRAYLVPGDEVLVGKRKGEFACVWYQGRKHESVAWVPLRNVTARPAPPLDPVRGWVGAWSDGSGTIQISHSRSKGLQLRSRLRWHGGDTPSGEPLVHHGGMRGALAVQGTRGRAVERDCELDLSRVGNYLVADDNGACGGMNVRHTGVYRRQAD